MTMWQRPWNSMTKTRRRAMKEEAIQAGFRDAGRWYHEIAKGAGEGLEEWQERRKGWEEGLEARKMPGVWELSVALEGWLERVKGWESGSAEHSFLVAALENALTGTESCWKFWEGVKRGVILKGLQAFAEEGGGDAGAGGGE